MINALQERAVRADVAFEVGPPGFMRVSIKRDDLSILEPASVGLRFPIRIEALQMIRSSSAPAGSLIPVLSAIRRKLSLKQSHDGTFLLGGGWPGDITEDGRAYRLRLESIERNWSENRSSYMAPDHETSLVVEVPCFPNDPIDRLTPDELAQRVVAELVQLSLISRDEVIEWKHHYLANAYPVYVQNYAERVSIIRAALKAIANLDTIG